MEEKIKLLKEKLQSFGTRDLLGMIGVQFLTFGNNAADVTEQSDIFKKTDLTSPHKQYTYLAGLLMSTDDHSNGVTNDNFRKYKELEEDIESITLEYTKTFLDFGDTPDNPDFDIVKRNLVSMQAFTSYFDMDILRYKEQTENLIKGLYIPFNKELEQLTSLNVNDYLTFFHMIEDSFSNALDDGKAATQRLQTFLNSFDPTPGNIENEFQRLISGDNGRIGREIQNAMDVLNTISKDKLIHTFGEAKGKKLLEIFALERKERNFLFYNRPNPFAEKPLCWLDNGQTLYIVHPTFVLSAIFNFITNTLENPKNSFAEKYKREKGNITENLFHQQLVKVFGDSATYHTSVCEERGTKEHDILIEYKDYIFIAEVKASKVREPFFNPQKAFPRIKDHFNSDTGIGGAYQQAIVLKKLIESSDVLTLYEEKTKPFALTHCSSKTILPLVLTLNQFGSIAVNTTLLLDKEDDQPYPWVCNLHDLENIIEINTYLKKDTRDFIEYILWRIKNHKVTLSSDELDVIEGYYFDKNARIAKDTNMFFLPTGPSLIDKIYFEKKCIPYHFPPLDSMPLKSQKVGRNDPCSCGSGKKYKKCCGA
ncbi:SEC-C motif domain protein [Ruminiclostridium cellulolyticum H10]|uniref:SEC-C motif domain protein n=1 Tax=Ruminiclostridium cellulolyticum (strain ATCC 35319 / DSM 5812 / JCM 6584 / H10) TaxID=394503 RepID=B8I4A5_RUMCH|nr:SEC-C motif domain protein [Ruminiclostridium cellulolyticum H10]